MKSSGHSTTRAENAARLASWVASYCEQVCAGEMTTHGPADTPTRSQAAPPPHPAGWTAGWTAGRHADAAARLAPRRHRCGSTLARDTGGQRTGPNGRRHPPALVLGPAPHG